MGPHGNLYGDDTVDGHSLKITRPGDNTMQMIIYDDLSFEGASRKFYDREERWAANRCHKDGVGWGTCADKTGWLSATIAK